MLKPCRNNFCWFSKIEIQYTKKPATKAGQKSWSHAASFVCVCVCPCLLWWRWWGFFVGWSGQSWHQTVLKVRSLGRPVRIPGDNGKSLYRKVIPCGGIRSSTPLIYSGVRAHGRGAGVRLDTRCVYICKNISSYFFALQIDNINSKLYMENIYGDWKRIHRIGYANLKC